MTTPDVSPSGARRRSGRARATAAGRAAIVRLLRAPRRVHGVASLALAALAAVMGCGVAAPEPLARIASAGPTGAVEPDRVAVVVTFTAPVDPAGVVDGRYFALCRREDLREVALAAETEAGAGPGAPVVASRARLEDGGKRAVLEPAAPLEPGRPWAAVLSSRARSADGRPILDPDGKPKSYALLFETGPAPDRTPPRARWLSPPVGSVPANVASLRVAFDEPVTGALAVAADATARPVAEGGGAVLGLDLDAPLAPGPLGLDVSAVRDAAGNPALPPEPLEVSRCRSDAAPSVSGVRAASGELSVRLEATLAGLGRLGAELSAGEGAAACGAAPAAPESRVVMGEAVACPGHDPCRPAAVACAGAVEVRGLCPGQPLRARVFSEDLAGHRGAAGPWIEVAAAPPRPRLVLTEALAAAAAPQAGGEYVEIANVGTGPADLTGHRLAKRGASGAFTRCALAPVAAAELVPGAYALVVGGAYDGRYALPAGTVLYRCGASALDGGLADDRPVALALEDAEGAVLSTAGIGEAAPRCPQGALERIEPAGPDVASNWTCPGARTPGACNRTTPPDSCPRRPW